MISLLENAGGFTRNAASSVRRHGRNAVTSVRHHGRKAVVGGVALATVGAANAQTAANAGIAEVVDAISDLKPDLAFVVTAAILVALVGIGAAVALSLGKRLIGK